VLLLGDVAVHGIVPDHLLVDLANEYATHTFHAGNHDIEDTLLQEPQGEEILDGVFGEHDTHDQLLGIGV